ncbi:hypothetical protein DAEQUDRAFT_765577 [Daedalea quercina L-15889]|uniref:Uncharacterized protein n=1 Tax=Daedalea quercina L-15889 TaxID=1314783 RepID=A0A165QC07_9APHY|nr:hypothetical protein DAEQUDRAFT_765577 [Daedalea quercina L-15889]
MPAHPWDTYTEEMRERFSCYGIALWDPDPHLGTIGADIGNVQIGDVGRIVRGRYHRLFNTVTGIADSHWNVPEAFERLGREEIEPLITREEISQSCLSSASFVTINTDGRATASGGAGGAGLSFKCTKSRGAILQLPECDRTNMATSGSNRAAASGERLNINKKINDFVARNIDTWHQFALEIAGWEVEKLDLIFVSGYLETKYWTVATCTDHGVDVQVSIQGGHGPLTVSFSAGRSQGNSPFCHAKWGPSEETPRRQCIFLEVLRGSGRSALERLKLKLLLSMPRYNRVTNTDSPGRSSSRHGITESGESSAPHMTTPQTIFGGQMFMEDQVDASIREDEDVGPASDLFDFLNHAHSF